MENPLCYKCMAGEECSLGGVPCTLVMWNRVEELLRRVDMWDWKKILTAVRRIEEARRHLDDENSKTWVNFIRNYDAKKENVDERKSDKRQTAAREEKKQTLRKRCNDGASIQKPRKSLTKCKHGSLFLKARRHAKCVLQKRF